MFSKTTRSETSWRLCLRPWWGLDHKAISGSINGQTKSLFGYNRDDLTGQPMETLVPEPRWQVYASHREDYFVGRRARSVGLGLELRRRHGDRGSGFPANISLSHVDAGDVLLDQGGR